MECQNIFTNRFQVTHFADFMMVKLSASGVHITRLLKLVFFSALFLLPALVFAGDGGGKITRIYAHQKITNNVNTGVILFAVAIHNNPPACSGAEWAFNADTAHGKAMYALLLSAAAQGKPVYINGAGDCADWGDRERPFWISISY